MGGQSYAPAVLTPGKSRYPLYRRLDGSQSRSGNLAPPHRDSIPGPSSEYWVAITYWAVFAPKFVQWHPLCMGCHCGTITLLAPRIMRWLVGYGYCVSLIQAVCSGSLRTKCLRCGHLEGDRHFNFAHLSRHFLLSRPQGSYGYDLSQKQPLGLAYDKL